MDDRGEDLVPPAPARSYFHFRLSRELLGYPAEAKRLTLYVCDQPLLLKETLWGSDEGTLFWWPRPMGIDWGTDENRTLYLVRDLTPPAMVSATVEGQKLLLSFDEDVLGWSSGILLRWNTALGAEGVVRSPYISQPVNARTMELTLQSKMYGDDTDLRLAYSGMDEAGGNAFRDAAGNTVANFTGLAVENLSQGERPDTAVLDPILNPLRLLRGAADGDIVRLTFSRPMRRPQLQFDDFLVQADNLIHELESVTVEGLVVTLTLQQAIKAGQAVTFGYTPSSTPLQDSQGNPVPRIRRTALLNETGGGTTTSLTDGKSQTVPSGGDSTTTPGDGNSQTCPVAATRQLRLATANRRPCPAAATRQLRLATANRRPCPVAATRQLRLATANRRPCPAAATRQLRLATANRRPCPVAATRQLRLATANRRPCPVAATRQLRLATANRRPCPAAATRQLRLATANRRPCPVAATHRLRPRQPVRYRLRRRSGQQRPRCRQRRR